MPTLRSMGRAGMKRHSAEERRWFAAVASLETCVLCGKYGVQVAHQNEERGVGQKSKPYQTAALCPECHYAIDSGKELDQVQRRALMARAIVRTHGALIECGILRISR